MVTGLLHDHFGWQKCSVAGWYILFLLVNMSRGIFLEYYQELERSAKDRYLEKLGGGGGGMWLIPIGHIHVYHCIYHSGNQLSSSSYF